MDYMSVRQLRVSSSYSLLMETHDGWPWVVSTVITVID